MTSENRIVQGDVRDRIMFLSQKIRIIVDGFTDRDKCLIDCHAAAKLVDIKLTDDMLKRINDWILKELNTRSRHAKLKTDYLRSKISSRAAIRRDGKSKPKPKQRFKKARINVEVNDMQGGTYARAIGVGFTEDQAGMLAHLDIEIKDELRVEAIQFINKVMHPPRRVFKLSVRQIAAGLLIAAVGLFAVALPLAVQFL